LFRALSLGTAGRNPFLRILDALAAFRQRQSEREIRSSATASTATVQMALSCPPLPSAMQ
jgi:hypothetical protein